MARCLGLVLTLKVTSQTGMCIYIVKNSVGKMPKSKNYNSAINLKLAHSTHPILPSVNLH